MEIVAENARHALLQTARAVMQHGTEVAPRGLKTRELEHFTVRIRDAADWHCSGMNAGWGPKVATLEALQLVGGFSSPELVRLHTPGVADFVNERGDFDGAYGPRVAMVLKSVVERLQNDPDTRQAVIPIWNASDANRPTSKDYPCTCAIGFSIRRDKLHMSVAMRSNDVDYGLKHDMSQFAILQCTVADALRISVGSYRHTAFSMHLYERSWAWAEDLEDNWDFVNPDIPRAGVSTGQYGTILHAMTRAQQLANNLTISNETPAERWFRETLYDY